MSGRASVWMRLSRVMTVGLLVLLNGCTGFFPPLTGTGGGSGGDGGSTTGDFVYVANVATQSIAGFAVSTSSAGAATLTAVSGSPYAFPVQDPTAMAITPNNGLLYVAALGGIYAYSINSSTGVLAAENSGSAEAITSLGSVSLDISPDGQWLFALSDDGITFYEFQINSSTGALSAINQLQYVGAGTNGATVVPKMIKVAPSGAYVFVALGSGGDLVYTLNTTTGALSTQPVQTLQGSPTSSDNALAIDSGTGFLYIARSGTGNGLAVYKIGVGGLLTSVAGSPFTSGQAPMWVQLDSTGKYVYVANRTDSTISGYSIGTGGVLTALIGSPYQSGSGVNSLARDNSGTYILASALGGSPDLTMYSFDATKAGALDSATTATTGTDPTQPSMVVATH
jgi:6-phosphogluconolactonase